MHSMDFLVTWNCAHIANAATAKVLASICRELCMGMPGHLYARGIVGRIGHVEGSHCR